MQQRTEPVEHRKRFLLPIAAVALLLILLSAPLQEASPFSTVERIAKEELRELLDNPEITILDARSDKDWQSSNRKIKGAVREDPQDAESWAHKYPKDKKLILYCG